MFLMIREIVLLMELVNSFIFVLVNCMMNLLKVSCWMVYCELENLEILLVLMGVILEKVVCGCFLI